MIYFFEFPSLKVSNLKVLEYNVFMTVLAWAMEVANLNNAPG